MRLLKRAAALCAGFALMGTIASAQSGSLDREDAKQNWLVTIEEDDHGHRLGNPDAETKLVEFMSYTCNHCAEFTRNGEGAVKLAYVPTGKVSFEIRHLLRDPVDLTAALLSHCGEPNRFMQNHTAIMLKQGEWFEAARKTSQAQRARWQFGSNSARRQAIASDLGFYDIMEGRGYDRAEIDRCLADEEKAAALAETSQRDVQTFGLQGTPSFLINDELLGGVHAWETLQRELDERL